MNGQIGLNLHRSSQSLNKASNGLIFKWENQNTTTFETWKFGRDAKVYSSQSRGSLYELIDHVDVALECKYLNNNHAESLMEEIKTAIRILNGYIKYLKGRKEDRQ